MPIFRKGTGPFDVEIAMTGVKLGDRLLQIGVGDGRLLAALAAKVGLTGRACGVDPDAGALERGRAAATSGAVLVDFERAPFEALPFDADSFDLAVIPDRLAELTPEARAGCLQEVHRVLRPGGRCLVIDGSPRGGLARVLSRRSENPHYVSGGRAEGALRAEGFTAIRTLAEHAGRAFVYGIVPHPDAGS